MPALDALQNQYSGVDVVYNSLETLLPLIRGLRNANSANDVQTVVQGLNSALSGRFAVADVADNMVKTARPDMVPLLKNFAAAVRQHGQVLRKYVSVLGSSVSAINVQALEAAVNELQQASQAVYAARGAFGPDLVRRGVWFVIRLGAITGGTLELDAGLIEATGFYFKPLYCRSNSVVIGALRTLKTELSEVATVLDVYVPKQY